MPAATARVHGKGEVVRIRGVDDVIKDAGQYVPLMETALRPSVAPLGGLVGFGGDIG